MSYLIGVDTGGTFTDAVAIDDAGHVVTGKAATTAQRLGEGILDSVGDAARQVGRTLEDFLADTRIFRFSGTTAINALLTGSGAPTGLVTTAGFEDILDIGRGMSAWTGLGATEVRRAYRQRKAPLVVPRRLTRGVHERIDRDGRIVVPLDIAEVLARTDELLAAGAEALAVGFLWSVRNPEHERRARDAIAAAHPGLFVCASHEIAAHLGEYERFNTAVINAYVAPRLTASLDELDALLRARGFKGELLVAQSDGGALYVGETVPAYTLKSGPAGGVIASRSEGELLGHANVITTDVGGTSFDVGIVAGGSWIVARHPLVGRYPVGFPMIEVESIGAGGGSIAWIDDGGALNVGPQSAGARPGPACYGRGGTLPTVTDAAAVLGYLNPDYFLDGRNALRLDLAHAAISGIADTLGMSVEDAAAGIFAIANAHMSALVSRQVIAQGYDPRDFTLYAFGGGGAMHAAFYATELAIAEVVVPALAGTFSALGVATAPLLHRASALELAAMPVDADRFNAIFARLEAKVAERLDRNAVPAERRNIVYSLDMRYGVQVNTVSVPVARQAYDAAGIARIGEQFDAQYETLYGKGSAFTEGGRFVTAFSVEGYGYLPTPERPAAATLSADASAARIATRAVRFGAAYAPAPIYRATLLRPGNAIAGPAIVEAPHTTIVIPPDFHATVDPWGNVRIAAPAGAAAGGRA
ncbi:MAG: hydantoinase/oxoprolinase family protein [Alphaproteobacteria bacterium]